MYLACRASLGHVVGRSLRILAFVLALAACGDRARTTQPPTAVAADPAPIAAVDARGGEGPDEPARPTVIALGNTSAGLALVDDHGGTLYTSSTDGVRRSNCRDACARTWLPVVSRGGKPQAGGGIDPSDVGSILRDDGTYQVTVDGRPLYHFAGDGGPGQARGQGRQEFGAVWSAATPPDGPMAGRG